MQEGFRKAVRFLSRWALVLSGLVLVAAAGVHRLQLDTAMPEPYTSSPLIALEVMLIPFMGLILIAHFFRSIHLALHKRWRELGILSVKTAVGLACIVAALQIDAPTLLYRT